MSSATYIFYQTHHPQICIKSHHIQLWWVSNNNIYRCVEAASNASYLANTLSQIYIYQWQQILLNQAASLGSELFGRCKNQLFFTWNRSTSEYHDLLAKSSEKEIHIQYKVNVGYRIHSLNINIENRNGTLSTNVFRAENIQKYTLPYVIGDTQVEQSHWLQSALIRAVRYCTSVNDFNCERVYLEMICLANGYPLDVIERRINHFYTHFNVKSLKVNYENVYLISFVYRNSFNLRTIHKRKRNDVFNWHMCMNTVRNSNLTNNYNRFFPIIWGQIYICQKIKKSKLIFLTKQQYSLNALLSEQKPGQTDRWFSFYYHQSVNRIHTSNHQWTKSNSSYNFAHASYINKRYCNVTFITS